MRPEFDWKTGVIRTNRAKQSQTKRGADADNSMVAIAITVAALPMRFMLLTVGTHCKLSENGVFPSILVS